MKPAVPPLAAAAPPLPEPTESSRCPFRGLQVLELSPPAGASRGSKGRRQRKEKPAGYRAHPLPPPQAGKAPSQKLPGRQRAGPGLQNGLTARGWVPLGLTPLWDVNSLPFPEGVCVSTLQVTLHPQILLLTFGTLILRERKMEWRGESSNIPGTWGPREGGQRQDPSIPQPPNPRAGPPTLEGSQPL